MSSLLSYDIDTGLDTYRLLVNSIEDYAIILLDIYGVVKIWNKGAEAIKGYKAEEIIGQNFEILYSADDRDKKTPSKNLEDTLRLGHIRYEGWRMRRDGSLFWAHVSITALYDRDKKLVGFSKITSDLTEKHNAQAEKEKEHEILDIIHHTAHIGGWELDVARQKITWSSVTCEIHEVPEGFQPTLAEAISFYKEGDSRDIIQKIYQEAVANGTAYDVDLPVITATGREIWCRSIGQAEIRDGRCVRLYGTFQDIDQQKRTQIELQLSEERFRNAFDLSAIGMALVSVEAVPIRVNKRLSELLGYTCEEFYAMTVFDFTHPDDIPADKAYAQQLLNGEIDHYRMVKRYFHKNGNTVWSHITVSLVRDAQHIPVHFVSEVEDITEQKNAEDQLRAANAELKALLNTGIRVGIISTDLTGTITHFNKGAEDLFGYSAEDVIGHVTPLFIQPAHAVDQLREELSAKYGKELSGFEAMSDKVRRDGHESKEILYQRIDGSTFPGHSIVSPIRGGQGDITGFLAICTDITQIKEAEASIRKYALLEAKNKEMEQFTFIASHDLLEPLQTVSSFVSLLEEEYHDKLGEDGQKYINFISGSTSRMMELVKGLLHYSRLGRERTLHNIDCADLLADVVDDLGLLIADTGTTIDIGPMPVITAYALEMKQLFQNLIRNAIKFRKPDVPLRIDISASRENNRWTFIVADNGIGIEDKNKEKIFVIFQRLHDRHEYDGTGIGLAYCRKIVDLHNGNIWVKSTPGEGSAFYFTIQT